MEEANLPLLQPAIVARFKFEIGGTNPPRYNVRSQGNPELRSWTFSKDTVLLQLDGSMPRDKAQKYEAALP